MPSVWDVGRGKVQTRERKIFWGGNPGPGPFIEKTQLKRTVSRHRAARGQPENGGKGDDGGGYWGAPVKRRGFGLEKKGKKTLWLQSTRARRFWGHSIAKGKVH